MSNNLDKAVIQDSQIKSEYDAYFRCCLCQHLVSPDSPSECSSCHVVFCLSCIQEYFVNQWPNSNQDSKRSQINQLQFFKFCPRGCYDFNPIQLHTFAKQVLDTTILKCPRDECTIEVCYKDYLYHVNEDCCQIELKCKCGTVVKKQDYQQHIDKVCTQVIVQCSKCQLTLKREDYEKSHDCILALIGKNKNLEERLAMAQESQLQSISLDPSRIRKLCPSKHLMIQMFPNHKSSNKDISCLICQTEMINNEPFYWKCNGEHCDQTICHFCLFEDQSCSGAYSILNTTTQSMIKTENSSSRLF